VPVVRLELVELIQLFLFPHVVVGFHDERLVLDR
jgi:hypothetical protein